MTRHLLIIFLIVLSVACSRSKTSDEVQNVESMELSDAGLDGNDPLLGDELDERMALESSDDGGVFVEGQSMQEPEAVATEDTALAGVSDYQEPTQTVDMSEGYGEYVVEKNETLMLIAFKLYGDYSRWNEIADLNRNKISNNSIIRPGTTLKYAKSGSGFSWNPRGNPYLIKQNDTLSKISNKVYGTSSQWKPIWKNNQALIKNPDRIFSGFTIYYPNRAE